MKLELEARVTHKITPPDADHCALEHRFCNKASTPLCNAGGYLICCSLDFFATKKWLLGGAVNRPKSCKRATMRRRNKADPEADPLEPYPALKEFWPDLKTLCKCAYPNVTFPDNKKGRKVLSDLVETDGYSETNIIRTINWWFHSKSTGAAFWRKNCKTILGLRKVRGDCGSKFSQMLEESNGCSAGASNPPPVTRDRSQEDVELPF